MSPQPHSEKCTALGEGTVTPEAAKEGARSESDECPDGGFLAWTQVAGAFFIFFNTWGIVNSYGVYQKYYETGLLSSSSGSNISWIGSAQGGLLFLVSIVAGPLCDMGYLRPIVYVGTFLTTLGMMMTSLCQSYWQVFIAQGLLVGAGDGLLFLPSIVIVSQYFSKKKSFATGIASMGSSIGAVLYPVVFAQLEPSVGFRWATRTIAFIMIATSIVTVVGVRQRTQPSLNRSKIFDIASFRDAPFIYFSLGVFFGFMGIYVLFFYVELYGLQECHMDSNLATYLLAIVNAGSLFGRLIPNYLADRVGPLNIHVPFAFVAALLAFSWIAVRDTASLIVYGVFYGFFSGTFVSLPGPIVVGISKDFPKLIGTRLGMSMGCAGIGLLIGSPVAGAILDKHGWVGLQAWAGSLITISALCMLRARGTKFGWALGTLA